jgi:hypothetical protein
VITLSEETDVSTVAELSDPGHRPAILWDAAPDDRCVRVEFRRFDLGSGTGVRRQDFAQRGGLVLLCPQWALARMLEIMGADPMITIRGETEATLEPERDPPAVCAASSKLANRRRP